MLNLKMPYKSFYTESEAAAELGISVAELQAILDANIFNDGSARPARLELQASDLLMLSYWVETRSRETGKVVSMPKRS